jgi:putative flippase GtrA
MRRLLVFSLIGAAGAVVQLAALALLVHGLGVPYLPATACAVVLAVQHNFLWHERWTWRERAIPCRDRRWRRCLAFHLGNGLVSLAGNLVVMPMAVEVFHFALLPANLGAIAACCAANFLVADRKVWGPRDGTRRPRPVSRNPRQTRQEPREPAAIVGT